MKKSILCLQLSALSLISGLVTNAHAGVKYELTLTNGSQTPISPPVIYSRAGESLASVGSQPTVGFVQICETGSTTTRLSELKADSSVKFITSLNAPIMPGESKTIEVDIFDTNSESIHLETMYGKTKDVCGVASINSHSLVALRQHVTNVVFYKDNVVLTGAFTEPVLPTGMTYLDPSLCASAMNAISCLRELSVKKPGKAQIRFFSGYLPSLINALEMKYGATDVQTLLFPSSGAIELKLKLKH